MISKGVISQMIGEDDWKKLQFSQDRRISLFFLALFAVVLFERQKWLWDYIPTFPLILICLLGVLVYYYMKRKHSYWDHFGVQCPAPTPIVGHIFKRLGITTPFMKFFDDAYYNHGGRDFCGFYDFAKPGLFVGNLQVAQNILINDYDHFANRRVFPLAKLSPIANDMLSNATGESWRRIRTAISPAFTQHKLKQMVSLICQRADRFVENLKSGVDGKQEAEMREVCGQFTMDTIASCAFGIECDSADADGKIFAQNAARVFMLSPVRALKIVTLLVAPWLAHLVHSLGVNFTSPEFLFFYKVVTKTLRFREESGFRRGDFIDLMKDTNKLSERTMAAQSILFLLAGYDNTANTLALALHMLSIRRDIQEKLREELKQVKRDEEGVPDFQILIALPLLDAVVKETLRLYPAAPVVERMCTKDYIIPDTKIPISKGQSIIFPVWTIHRDAANWKKPNEFFPERFLDIPENRNDDLTFIAFGAGPRSCIGTKFAYLVVKIGLLKVISQLDVFMTSNSEMYPTMDPRVLTLQPKHGLPLTFSLLESTKLWST